MATTMVHIRVDEKVKEKAAKTLAAMGISVSDAVRMLLPFDIKIPNATTIKAMKAVDRGNVRRYPNAEALLKDLGI
jgi:DNA-damage-inducible protein J